MSDSVSWMRLYHSFLDNDKTGCLSLADRGAWVTLAILASRNSPRGKIPPIAILKRYMGRSYAVNPSRIKRLLDRFIRLALIDSRPDGLYVHNFNTRQWISGGDNIGKQSNDNLSSGVSRVESENQQLVNTWSTNCCNDLLIPGEENKRDTGKRYTEKAATDTDTEYIGLQNAFIAFSELLQAIRQHSTCLPQALVDSPIGKQSSDNVLPFPASSRPAEGEGARGHRVSKARAVSQKSLPGAPRSAFDAAFRRTWALWQSLPGITHHKRFVDSDRQAFRRTWALLGGDAQALADIQTAIKRYSTWSTGAKAGKYRPAYRWTFTEFVRHKRGSLIQRLSSDSWEATCEPFAKASAKPDRSVASLLASASRLAAEGDA